MTGHDQSHDPQSITMKSWPVNQLILAPAAIAWYMYIKQHFSHKSNQTIQGKTSDEIFYGD